MGRRHVLLTLGACVAFAACTRSSSTGGTTPAPLTAKDIVHHSTPAIVRIEVGTDRIGTGFIVDAKGLVATNLHVVVGSSNITVKLKDGTKYPVLQILGIDPRRDLALLQIHAPTPLPILHLGDSDRMEAGDTVYAIGNPLGVFELSVTNGLISARRNACEGFPKSECNDVTYLQISAPISQGSSGGPLLNQGGEVIGITTAIINGGQNINVAIPTNYLKPMIAAPKAIALADFEKETKGMMGDHEGDPQGGEPLPARQVPTHATTIWDGCKLDDIEATVVEISSAIRRGAPEYNKRTTEGFENCYRIYEGTSLKLKTKVACKGVTKAFDDGLARAEKIATYRDKAWALRDTFDGLITVAERWCAADVTCRAKAQAPAPTPTP
ncbi:MAG: trypsin-like peptidase domain-containing protein [Proteobacteria bacterium]|nr:trypsin-like peptidase domain-containing protein [Pseudomonadota bacterium]